MAEQTGKVRASLGILAVAVLTGCLAGSAGAGTAAYWRFEDTTSGGVLLGDAGNTAIGSYTVTADSGDTGLNPLRTWDYPAPPADTSPRGTSSVGVATIPQTGAANGFAFDFQPNQDIYTVGGSPIESQSFKAYTIEALVRAEDLWYRRIVGKDGSGMTAPVQVWTRGTGIDPNLDQRFSFEGLDAAGQRFEVVSQNTVQMGQWYWLACVNDGVTARLYLKGVGEADYVLQNSAPVSGAMLDSTATWTVGRGYVNNGINDWWDGQIDEVRISDEALSPDQFLGTAPEPTTLSLLGLGGLWATRRRRK